MKPREGSILRGPLIDGIDNDTTPRLYCELQDCPVELLHPLEDCNVNSSLSFTLQICRVEDLNAEGLITGSVVHFHLVRTVVVHSPGVISASGLGCLSTTIPLPFAIISVVCPIVDVEVLCNIQVFTKAIPSLFAPYFEDFFIYSSESYQIKALKLEILSSIATESCISYIFKEFQYYIRDTDRRFAADTVATIGLCAQRLPNHANACLEGLVALITQEFLIGDFESADGEADVLIHAIMSIKSILKQDPPSNEKVRVDMGEPMNPTT